MNNIKKTLLRNSQVLVYLTVTLVTIGLAFLILESSSFQFDFSRFNLFSYPLESVFWSGLLILTCFFLFLWSLGSNIFIVSVLFITFFVGLGFSNVEKLTSTGNPIFWSDIVMGFHPVELFSLIDMSQYFWLLVLGALLFLSICYFQIAVWNKGYTLTKTGKLTKKKSLLIRGLVAILTGASLLMFLYQPNSSFTRVLLRKDNEHHKVWNMRHNYRTNGTTYSLIRNIHKIATDQPAGYSEGKIKDIHKKYRQRADEINQNRFETGKERKVIFLLSETFSDPQKIKGLTLEGNPIPNIQRLMKENVSGRVVVPGIGGGTSDTEWTVLSGLNMRLLNSDINFPYTDFFYGQKNPQTILEVLDPSLDQTVAIHATPPIYYRSADVYQNIGIRDYYSTANITDFKPVSKNKRFISDRSFFDVLLNKIKAPKNKVIISQSMQNHQPFNYEYFKDHRFSAQGDATQEELDRVRNYAQGLSITDQEIMRFLEKLEELEDDVTLVFYGDHIPVAYNPFANQNDYPTMHGADYFIYSNHGYTNGKDKKEVTGKVHSSSFIANKLLWSLDLKVSPFYAMTTELEKEVPIISREYLGTGTQQWREEELSSESRDYLNDYQMIAYDILNGQQFSIKQGFFSNGEISN